jgi:hypothetical protein
MSEIKHHGRYSGVDRRAARSEPGSAKPGAAVPRDGYKTGGRHGAITNSLYNWHSYKNWAEKVRGSWEDKK